MFSTDKLEYVLPLSLTNSPVQQTKQCSFKPNLFWSPMGQYITRCYQQVADGRVQYLTKFQHRHGPLFISHLEGSYISKWFTKKKKYIYILTDCSVRSSTCVSQWFPPFLKLSPLIFFASSLWARIFEAHAHACGPSFVSIPSYQSHINSFPHKPFWHTRMAYIQPSYLSSRELRKLAIYIYMYMNDIYTYMNDIYMNDIYTYEWDIYRYECYIYIYIDMNDI